MQKVKPCSTYAARPSGVAVYRAGATVYKVYYVDIYGRQEPERYEWDLCGRPRATVLEHLATTGIEGVGFVVAFPHITKVFRFAPSVETVLHVRAFRTADFAPLDLQREDGYTEFACYAEAVIAAAEYELWAKAATVEGYLEGRWPEAEARITDHAKLRRYMEQCESAAGESGP